MTIVGNLTQILSLESFSWKTNSHYDTKFFHARICAAINQDSCMKFTFRWILSWQQYLFCNNPNANIMPYYIQCHSFDWSIKMNGQLLRDKFVYYKLCKAHTSKYTLKTSMVQTRNTNGNDNWIVELFIDIL